MKILIVRALLWMAVHVSRMCDLEMFAVCGDYQVTNQGPKLNAYSYFCCHDNMLRVAANLAVNNIEDEDTPVQ